MTKLRRGKADHRQHHRDPGQPVPGAYHAARPALWQHPQERLGHQHREHRHMRHFRHRTGDKQPTDRKTRPARPKQSPHAHGSQQRQKQAHQVIASQPRTGNVVGSARVKELPARRQVQATAHLAKVGIPAHRRDLCRVRNATVRRQRELTLTQLDPGATAFLADGDKLIFAADRDAA